MTEKDNYRRYVGLVTPGLHRKIQLREYPPNKNYLIRPPSKKIEETAGLLEDKYYPMTTDANGFINPQYGNAAEDPNIVFLGGSTTECVWNDEAKRWPNLVAKIFNATREHNRINTINSGVWGNTTAQAINLLFNKIIPLKPFACVLMENINDLVLMIHEGDYWKAETPSRRMLVRTEYDGLSVDHAIKLSLKRKLASYKKALRFKQDNVQMQDEFSRVRMRESRLDPRDFKRLFTDNLNIFVSICLAKGIVPILMTQASRMTKEGEPQIRNHVDIMLQGKGLTYDVVVDYYSALNDCIRGVARAHGILCIDLDRLIPKTSRYMFDSVHFTDEGCELVAESISRSLAGLFAKETVSCIS